MKTKVIRKLIIAAVLTAGSITWIPSEARAEKGAERLMQGRPIKTVQDIEALKPGDLAVMSCPKCKTVTFSYVEEGRGANKPLKTGAKHTCAACKTTIETTGVGKAATDEIVHVCSQCGSDLANCCSLKKEELTKGMEEAAGAEKPAEKP